MYSTKVAKFVTSEMSDSQTLVETDVNTTQSVEYIDPLAQSFLCDTEGGVFLVQSLNCSLRLRTQIFPLE